MLVTVPRVSRYDTTRPRRSLVVLIWPESSLVMTTSGLPPTAQSLTIVRPGLLPFAGMRVRRILPLAS